jgi:hypothetical protein
VGNSFHALNDGTLSVLSSVLLQHITGHTIKADSTIREDNS